MLSKPLQGLLPILHAEALRTCSGTPLGTNYWRTNEENFIRLSMLGASAK